ncbi:MAG TPA: class I SAM-dependent rRNA methyltransferase [Terracidiphilus sp.]|nr:class I SAM-dependent rRNA methyltransferase [Terracidiphilus sp.]
MAKPHKPETAAPPRKRRAKTSAPIAAQGGHTAAFPRSVPASRESSPPARAASRPPIAGAIVNRRAADHLRSGHLWVYASDVVSVTLPKPEETLLPVADQRGIFLGTALYSPASQIALRLVSREALDHAAWLELLAARLRAAIARRKPMLDAANDACRLCFSEADELPGLIVDKYGDLVVLQFLTKGLLGAGVGEACVRVLREDLTPAAIFERPDPRIRELEGLPAPSPDPLWVAGQISTADRVSIATAARPVATTEFHLNGLVFQYDANAGQKTGAFLDQRTNYAAAQEWARHLGAVSPGSRGRALDVCCYQGGFALHLAQVCRQVTGIDSSRASLEVAERNLQANRARISAEVDWIEADAFEILRDWSQAGEKFDTIVLDPPAFAKTKRAVEGALRGYKELNLRALKMLDPGGLLVTCSCSHHVNWADLEAAVAAAAADASRRVRLLERRGAALDHPVVLNLPETEYLKCLVLEME